MDGMIGAPPEPLRIIKDGVRYGFAIPGKIAWLPAEMWAPAAELMRRMDRMNADMDRLEKLIAAARDEANAAGGVQHPYYGRDGLPLDAEGAGFDGR